MILCQTNFFSKILENHVNVTVLLPALFDNDVLFADLDAVYAPRRFRALYLLHGALEDETSWLRMTAIERYAQAHQVAVVMPRGENSFYVNALAGRRWMDFVLDELPRLVEYAFPISGRPEDRFIAGCSMGGYGSVRCALQRPERYAAFGDLSGAVDPARLEPLMTAMGFRFFRYDLLFGGTERVAGTENDLWALAERAAGAPLRPRGWIYCGKADAANLDMNRDLCAHLTRLGFDARFVEAEGGHDWGFWDWAIGDFLRQVCGENGR